MKASRTRVRPTVISLLGLDLKDYLAALPEGGAELAGCVEESGLACDRCGSGRCARPHAWRRRKKVTDLSTGAVFENVPIRRILFCTGRTASLVPAELWRGRFTLPSVLETGVHLLRDGLPATYDWTWDAGVDGSPVSPRTLRRWRQWIGKRVLAAAGPWWAQATGLTRSDAVPLAAQLEALLVKLSSLLLLAFRAAFGRALLDKAIARRAVPRRRARPIPGRHPPAPPPDPPPPIRRRGAWCSRRSRRSPPGDPKRGRDP